jgi:hypothetical protein
LGELWVCCLLVVRTSDIDQVSPQRQSNSLEVQQPGNRYDWVRWERARVAFPEPSIDRSVLEIKSPRKQVRLRPPTRLVGAGKYVNGTHRSFGSVVTVRLLGSLYIRYVFTLHDVLMMMDRVWCQTDRCQVPYFLDICNFALLHEPCQFNHIWPRGSPLSSPLATTLHVKVGGWPMKRRRWDICLWHRWRLLTSLG